MGWDPGPVLRKELLVTARRGRYYAARVAYGLCLLLALWQEYLGWSGLDPRFATIHNMGRFAESTFLAFAGGQGLALLVLVPALLAGTIADERQRNTLPDLLATGMTGGEIVAGKLGAGLVHAGVFLLLGLPVVSLVGLFGGLDPRDVLAVTLGTVSVTLFVAGLSILVSVVAPRPGRAIVTAYSLVAAWLFLTPVLGELAPHLAWPLWWVRPVNAAVLATNPLLVWGKMVGVVRFRFYPGGSSPWSVRGQDEALQALLLMAWLQLVAAALFVALAVWLLRPFQGVAVGRRRGRGRGRAAARVADRAGCGDHPMLWKERYAAGDRRSWLSSLPVVLVLGVVLGCFLFDAARPVFTAMVRYGGGPPLDQARLNLNRELRGAGAFVLAIAGLAVAGAAAASVSEERERGTWTGLLTTLLTGPEIVRAKMFGAVWGARRLVATVPAVWGVGLLGGAIHPLGFVAALACLAASLGFAAALGLFVSLKARNTTRALVATVGGLFALNLGVAMAAHAHARDRGGPSLLLAGSAPYVASVAPIAPQGVRALGVPQSFESGKSGGVPDEFPIVVPCLVAHALAALVLARAAARSIPAAADRARGRRASRRVPGPASGVATQQGSLVG